MNTKLSILFIGFIILLVLFISRKQSLKFLFWVGISLVFVRVLAVPVINQVNISYTIFTILILLNPYILLNKKSFKEWRLWYLVLLLGILNSFVVDQSNYFFVEDVFTRAFDWSSKFLVIIFVSSSITYFVKTEKDLKKLMYLFLTSCFIFSFTAIIAYFGFYDSVIIYGKGSLNEIQDYSRDVVYSEIYGISSSNLVFSVSAAAIVFIPYLNLKKWIKYFFLAILICSVIITLKRLAIITLILALIYYLLIEKKRGNNIWFIVIPILFLFVGTTYYDLIYKRFFNALDIVNGSSILDNSTAVRIRRYDFAWQIFLNNPLIGNGAGYLVFVHNGFLEILGNLGLLGLVLFQPLIKPLRGLKTSFYNPWAIAIILIMITLVALEAAINRVEIMYFIGLLYGGFLANKSINNIKQIPE